MVFIRFYPPKIICITNIILFFSVPLMHVLAIHMKVMMVPTKSVPGALSELWGALTCQWAGNKSDSGQQAGKLILRHNNVPLLMQDPLALMTHFILLLPLNVDLAYFKTVTRACFNLQLAQTLVRIAFTLSFRYVCMMIDNTKGQKISKGISLNFLPLVLPT